MSVTPKTLGEFAAQGWRLVAICSDCGTAGDNYEIDVRNAIAQHGDGYSTETYIQGLTYMMKQHCKACGRKLWVRALAPGEKL